MPKAITVKPKKWANILVLFDDGIYSYCWGNYDGSLHRKLGSRWNDNYPRQGNNPTWYVEYGIFTYSHIQEIIKSLIIKERELISSNICTKEEITGYIRNCETAIKEINLNIIEYHYDNKVY